MFFFLLHHTTHNDLRSQPDVPPFYEPNAFQLLAYFFAWNYTLWNRFRNGWNDLASIWKTCHIKSCFIASHHANIYIRCSVLWWWLSLWIFIIFNFDALSHILNLPFKVWMCLLVEHSLIVTRCSNYKLFRYSRWLWSSTTCHSMPARCIHAPHTLRCAAIKPELIHCIPMKLRIVGRSFNTFFMENTSHID